MLIDKTVIIRLGSNNMKHYRELGYSQLRRDDMLLVKTMDLPKTSNVKVKVSCEGCGEIRLVRYKDLTRSRKSKWGKDGFTYCKKCAKKVRWGNPLYVQYKQNAKKRNHVFALSEEEFAEINSQPCHYCGGMNEYSRISHKGNGVDRKDNSKGYVKDNCVPCCSVCNRGKGSMPYDDFIDYIQQLRNYEW